MLAPGESRLQPHAPLKENKGTKQRKRVAVYKGLHINRAKSGKNIIILSRCKELSKENLYRARHVISLLLFKSIATSLAISYSLAFRGKGTWPFKKYTWDCHQNRLLLHTPPTYTQLLFDALTLYLFLNSDTACPSSSSIIGML